MVNWYTSIFFAILIEEINIHDFLLKVIFVTSKKGSAFKGKVGANGHMSPLKKETKMKMAGLLFQVNIAFRFNKVK